MLGIIVFLMAYIYIFSKFYLSDDENVYKFRHVYTAWLVSSLILFIVGDGFGIYGDFYYWTRQISADPPGEGDQILYYYGVFLFIHLCIFLILNYIYKFSRLIKFIKLVPILTIIFMFSFIIIYITTPLIEYLME